MVFFNCKRGVRQGDLLSPLLFCIAEDVLNRGITNLVNEGKVELIKSSRHQHIPSHTLYAEDVMVFCKGKLSVIQALKNLFTDYANCSGQHINPSKSLMFSNSISNSRMNFLVNMLGFSIGTLPFNYLGVPIFKGKPKAACLQPIADKVKLKLAAWKASLLSIAGRVQLIKSVIHIMLIHTITVYSWPISLLKDLERMIWNFIWSGDVDKRKLVTVAWHKTCRPFNERGLGLRSLRTLNEAANLKVFWDLFQSNEDWAIALRSRACPNRKPIKYHIQSSIWSSIKSEFTNILENSNWIIGDGQLINFWNDNWLGQPLVSTLNLNPNIAQQLEAKVCDFIVNHEWNIPNHFSTLFPIIKQIPNQIVIPKIHMEDSLYWKHTRSSILSLKDAFNFKSTIFPQTPWAKIIWCPDIPPSKSFIVWRILH